MESYPIKYFTFGEKNDKKPDPKACIVAKVQQVVVHVLGLELEPTDCEHGWYQECIVIIKEIIRPSTHDVSKACKHEHAQIEGEFVHQSLAWRSSSKLLDILNLLVEMAIHFLRLYLELLHSFTPLICT